MQQVSQHQITPQNKKEKEMEKLRVEKIGMTDEAIPSEGCVQIDVALQVPLLNRSPSEDHGDSSRLSFLLSSPIDITPNSTTTPHGSFRILKQRKNTKKKKKKSRTKWTMKRIPGKNSAVKIFKY